MGYDFREIRPAGVLKHFLEREGTKPKAGSVEILGSGKNVLSGSGTQGVSQVLHSFRISRNSRIESGGGVENLRGGRVAFPANPVAEIP